MARSINEIMTIQLAAKTAAPSLAPLEVLTTSETNTLPNLTSTSKVSIWRLFLYITAVAIWTLENIFDLFTTEVLELIDQNQIGTDEWYKKIALEFQLGFDLTAMNVYDNTGVLESDIIASKIVKQAAIGAIGGRVLVKVATEVEGELAPITGSAWTSFKTYMARRKYAGTRLTFVSRIADDFKANFTIYYNPLILDASGARLDGTDDTPALNAVKNYLRNLKFNGEFSLTKLQDNLQLVQGIETPKIASPRAKFGANPYASISEFYEADAGYMKLDEENTTFIYIARELQ